MIYLRMPFRKDRNLGLAYNHEMELLPADAWAVFLDHDAAWTTPHWFTQWAEAIAFKPDTGAFVAMANRIGPAWQRCGPAGDDMREHRRFGDERRAVRTLLDITDTKGFGGVAFAVSKAVWQEVGGFAEGYMGCTDHNLHFKLQRAGRRSYVVESIYVYHGRISSEGNPAGMSYVPNCPCRGAELPPMRRLVFPDVDRH